MPGKAPEPQPKGASRAWEALTPALSEWILDAMSSMGFSMMTPVQASTIPLFMGNKDLVVEAVTGSGKTLAFLIPVIERLLRLSEPIKKHHVGAIIISPTRELATQIHSVLLSLLKFHPPSAAHLSTADSDSDMDIDTAPDLPAFPSSTLKVIPQLLLGGTTKPAQDLSTFLRTSPNLLIATPGRLLELLTSPHVHCPQSAFEVLVMDEADRLLDLGFVDTLSKILSRLPKQRRTGLFSASVSEAVSQLIRVGLRNPVRIAVKVKSLTTGQLDKRTPASLTMSYHLSPSSQKLPATIRLLTTLSPAPQKTIIFFPTCFSVDYFQHILPSLLPPEFTTIPLHGKHPSTVRTKNLAKFSGSISPSVLLTTDVAARGLDISAVDLVIQLAPPSDPKTFLHRCGRAGRAGRKGLAVTFLTPGKEEDYIEFLAIRKTPITPLSPTISVSADEATEVTARIRELVQQDRALHDKAQRGFVSAIRAYSKHTASSIFRVQDLDWLDLAAEWGLLRLPKMPELKGLEFDRSLGLNIDWDTYAYADKQRESARLLEASKTPEERAAKRAERGEELPSRKRKSEAWSGKKGEAEERVMRREKKAKRREGERVGKLTEEEKAKEREREEMIEKVRRRVQMEEAEGEFEGFSD